MRPVGTFGPVGGNLVSGASTPSPISITSLISAWDFGEFSDESAPVTRNDTYGTNHLTDTGNTASVTDGILGRAARFGTAGNEELGVNDNASIEIDADITLTCWVRRTGNLVTNAGLFGKWSNTVADQSFLVYASAATTVTAAGCVGITATLLGSSITLPLNEWHLLTFQKPASVAPFTLRLDANAALSSVSIAALNQGNNQLKFGRNGNSIFFNKNLDVCRARFAKRIWTVDEITAYYNSGTGLVWP